MTRINSLDPRAANLNPNALRVAGIQLREADEDGNARGAAGTIDADVTIPAYAAVVEILVYAEAVWDDATSAALDIGWVGGDVDGIYDNINLKATDLTADQGITFAYAGGKDGDDIGADRTLRATATLGDGTGTAGITFIYVVYAVPEMDLGTYTAS